MLWSHAGIVFGFPAPIGWGFWLFVVTSGSLWKARPIGRRYVEVAIAGVLSAPVTAALGLNAVNVLVAWAIVGPWLVWLNGKGPALTVAIAGVLLAEWPLPGINPGHLLLGWQLGHSVGAEHLAASCGRLGSVRVLRLVGRYPLTVYVAVHLGLWAVAAR